MIEYIEDLTIDKISVSKKYGRWKVDYFATGDIPIVQFTVISYGIPSSGCIKGFYYSPNDVVVGYQGIEIEYGKSKEGWIRTDCVGDDSEIIIKIKKNWYWFEVEY